MHEKRILNAVIDAINTERDAMYFYQRAALRMRDHKARELFTRLAAEEREHAESFFEIYHGVEIPELDRHLAAEDQQSDWLLELEGLLDGGFSDIQALQLAMLKERYLESQLRKAAGAISHPEVRSIYEINAQSTHQHFQLIEREYQRLAIQQ